mmetsp:Transcript_31491/g.91044  ORF Transcript_31491/g.91044 Transcript_31491/m.91044 type:complete len:237 (-) Transcript_31491:553-1263(-)
MGVPARTPPSLLGSRSSHAEGLQDRLLLLLLMRQLGAEGGRRLVRGRRGRVRGERGGEVEARGHGGVGLGKLRVALLAALSDLLVGSSVVRLPVERRVPVVEGHGENAACDGPREALDLARHRDLAELPPGVAFHLLLPDDDALVPSTRGDCAGAVRAPGHLAHPIGVGLHQQWRLLRPHLRIALPDGHRVVAAAAGEAHGRRAVVVRVPLAHGRPTNGLGATRVRLEDATPPLRL